MGWVAVIEQQLVGGWARSGHFLLPRRGRGGMRCYTTIHSQSGWTQARTKQGRGGTQRGHHPPMAHTEQGRPRSHPIHLWAQRAVRRHQWRAGGGQACGGVVEKGGAGVSLEAPKGQRDLEHTTQSLRSILHTSLPTSQPLQSPSTMERCTRFRASAVMPW